MRTRHNGFVQFMGKLDGKPTVSLNRPIEVGDKVLVKGIEYSASRLGRPIDYVGEVRQVYQVHAQSSDTVRYLLGESTSGSWYLAEDLELVS